MIAAICRVPALGKHIAGSEIGTAAQPLDAGEIGAVVDDNLSIAVDLGCIHHCSLEVYFKSLAAVSVFGLKHGISLPHLVYRVDSLGQRQVFKYDCTLLGEEAVFLGCNVELARPGDGHIGRADTLAALAAHRPCESHIGRGAGDLVGIGAEGRIATAVDQGVAVGVFDDNRLHRLQARLPIEVYRAELRIEPRCGLAARDKTDIGV